MPDVPTAKISDAGRRFGLREQFFVSCLWLAYNVQWSALIYVVLPAQIAAIVGPSRKELYEGLVVAVGAAVALLIPPLSGALSDRSRSRFGRRRPYLLAGGLIDIAFLLLLAGFGRGSSIALFTLCYLGLQLGANWLGGPYAGLIPDVVPRQHRGASSGWMAVMLALGSIAGGVLPIFLLHGTDFWPVYGVIAASLAVMLTLTLFGVREQPNLASAEKLQWGAFWRSFLLDPRKYRDFYWVLATRAMVTMGMFSIAPFFQYFLKDIIKVAAPAATSGMLIAVITTMSIPTSLIAGRLSDRHGRKPMVYLSGGVMALACMVYIAVAFFPNLGFTLVVAAIFGLGYGAYMAVDWALGIDVLPASEDAAKDMGIWHVSMVLPQMIAPAITGVVLDAFKKTSLLSGYSVVFAMTALWLLLGTVFVRQIRGVR